MPNILIAEGTPAVWQAERAEFGIPSNFSLFAAAVQLHHPGIGCTGLNIADGEVLPFGTTLSDFDGVMFPGSPLHIYDPSPSLPGRSILLVLPLPLGCRSGAAAGVCSSPQWHSGDRYGATLGDANSDCAGDHRDGSRPGPPASRVPSYRFRRALLAPRRDRNLATELSGAGRERALRHSGDSHTNSMAGQLSRHAVSPRAHSGGLGSPHRDESRGACRRGLWHRAVRDCRDRSRLSRPGRRAYPPRPDLAVWDCERDYGSHSPDDRDRQLAADRR